MKFSRRRFLRATGISLALPWLDSLVSAASPARKKTSSCSSDVWQTAAFGAIDETTNDIKTIALTQGISRHTNIQSGRVLRKYTRGGIEDKNLTAMFREHIKMFPGRGYQRKDNGQKRLEKK